MDAKIMTNLLKEDKYYWENMQKMAEDFVAMRIECKEQYFINLPQIKTAAMIIETYRKLEIV